MPRLIYIMKESGDPSLRLSALWAVKNVLRKTSTETKRDVMSHLGWSHLVEYVFHLSSIDNLVYDLSSGYWVIQTKTYRNRLSM